MDGLPDGRVAWRTGFVTDSNILDGRVAGLPGIVILLMNPDANKRAAGYRLS